MQQIIRKRPVLLTIICITGYIWIVFSFIGVFNPELKKQSIWYPALFGVIVASSFISYIGIWHMKKWGVQLFLLAFFTKQAALILTSVISLPGLILSIIFIIPLMIYYRRMDNNL